MGIAGERARRGEGLGKKLEGFCIKRDSVIDNLLRLNSVNNIFVLFTTSSLSLVSRRLWLGMLFWASGCKVHNQTS